MHSSQLTFTWGVRDVRFEIRTFHPEVIEHARCVLGGWAALPEASLCKSYLIEKEGAGAWRIEPSMPEAPERFGSVSRVVRAAEMAAVFAYLEHAEAPLTVHGALVAHKGCGIIVMGASQTGKSTLSTALWMRGWSLMADDITILTQNPFRLGGTPRRVSLREGSRSLLGDELFERIQATPGAAQTAEGWVYDPRDLDGRCRSHLVKPLAGIILGRKNASAPPAKLVRLPPAHALFAFLPYTNYARKMELQALLPVLSSFAEALPIFDMTRGHIDDMIDEIVTLYNSLYIKTKEGS